MKCVKLIFGQSSFFLCLALIMSSTLSAQQSDDMEKMKEEANSYLNEAEKALGENDFASAEAAYRKAIAKDPSNTAAKYNMGNLYYNREKSGESQSKFVAAKEVSENKEDRHRINHNLGNSFMKQKKYKEAVEAYKNALRNDPTDDETRYNLALAKKKLEEEQEKNQDNKDNQDDQENKDQNEDKQDQDKDQDDKGDEGKDKDEEGDPKDEGDNKEQDPKDGEGDQENEKPNEPDPKEQNKGDQDEKDQKGKPDEQKQQKPQPAQGQLSPQQIKSLLEAMNNEEEKVQDKINAEKAKGVKTRSDKDW